jgi:serine/threonine protein kinase
MDKNNPTEKLYNLEIIKEISKGHFGILYKARTCDKKIVALKVIKNSDHHAVENSKKELFVYSNLPSHPNILKCLGYAEKNDRFLILFEYLDNKDLWEYFFKDPNKKLSDKKIAQYIWQLCDALQFLHKHNIIHADVKLENILIDNKDQIRLCDFGLSDIRSKDYNSEYRRGICGTIGYIAPEIYKDEIANVTPYIDVWAVGVVLYELLYHKSPFVSSANNDECRKTDGSMDRKILYQIMTTFPSLPTDVDDDLLDLFQQIFETEPRYRISLDDIKRHKWMKKTIKNETIKTPSKIPFKNPFKNP